MHFLECEPVQELTIPEQFLNWSWITYKISQGLSFSDRVICQFSWAQTSLRSSNPDPHFYLVIYQNIVLEKFLSCLFSPSQQILNTTNISFIHKWGIHLNNREGVDEPRWLERSFKWFEYVTFCFNFALIVFTSIAKQLNKETSLWCLFSAKQLWKEAPRMPHWSCVTSCMHS